jgi:hypothetical protein
MPVTLNASTSTGLIQTADTSGTVEIQSNGTTRLTVASTGVTIGGTFGGSVITSGTAVASTSGTSIDFTGIPSWVKRITVMFSGVSTSGSSNFLFQLGDAGGIETTGYQSVGSNYVAASTSTIGFVSHNTSSTVTSEGFIQFSAFGSNVWVGSGNFASVTAAQVVSMAGSKTLSDTLTQVRITTVNGTDTFDAGSINILYEG